MEAAQQQLDNSEPEIAKKDKIIRERMAARKTLLKVIKNKPQKRSVRKSCLRSPKDLLFYVEARSRNIFLTLQHGLIKKGMRQSQSR